MKLSKQQQKVYDYIQANPGSKTKDIRDATFVQCPTGRMSEMRGLGIVFKEVGEKTYPGAKPFKMYAIDEPKPIMLPKKASQAKTLAMAL
jgi:hypothetical protein